MIRRVIVALALLTGGVGFLAAPAVGDLLYPPVPITQVAKPVREVVVKPRIVVVVREAPVRRQEFAVTGPTTVLPMTALAAGAVVFGMGMVVLTRVRRPDFTQYRERP